ncbi:MAG: hypothetical protein KatS3mg131_0114 [Candidatus Tectimicrobiota bacterium]|nr:MAG: hypothetical protein KatS3mg131_0114 [Candidatus Tectomicrobia bacterium]
MKPTSGFSFAEVMLSLALLGVLALPLTVGLTGTLSGVSVRETQTALANAARGKMEEVLAMGFANVPLSSPPGTPGPLSDTVTIRGRAVARQVIVDLADGDLPPDGQPDADFKQITVTVGNVTLHSALAAGW